MSEFNLDTLTEEDFATILSDLGETVVLNRYTKTTSNITGDEDITGSYGSNINITAVFQLEQRKYTYDKEGITEQGDATLFSRPADSVDKDDKITFDSKVYLVVRKARRNGLDKCTLELFTR